MKRALRSAVAGLLLVSGAFSLEAQTPPRPVQAGAATALAGTWRSGNFAYTFNRDGSYVYVGAMGGTPMRTQISEEGTYAVSGDVLTVARKRGLITNSQNYRQVLTPEVTTFRFRAGNTPSGPALQLIFPNGQGQVFYRQ
jgi:hypothetical protein